MKLIELRHGGLPCEQFTADDLGLSLEEHIVSRVEKNGFCEFLVGVGAQGRSIARNGQAVAQPRTGGPGTELHALLAALGLAQTSSCACKNGVALMDINGCDWCEAHLDEIVGWLREEAAQRGLPFLDMAGRVLVRRAISNARKEQARATQASSACGSLPHEHGWPAPPKSAVD